LHGVYLLSVILRVRESPISAVVCASRHETKIGIGL
jgi:hypothetical protein